MAQRLLAWLSAGVLAAGLCAATVAGAGVSVADDGPTGGGGDGHTSQKPNDDATKDDSGNKRPPGGHAPTGDKTPPKVDDTSPGDPPTSDNDGKPDGTALGDADQDAGKIDGAVAGDNAHKPRHVHTRPPDPDGNRADSDERPRVRDDRKFDPPTVHVDTHDEQVDAVKTSEPVDVPEQVRDTETLMASHAPASDSAASAISATPPKPNVIESIVGAVSSIVTSLLNPFATNPAPTQPATQPQLWTMAAAARNEFENAFAGPSLAADATPVVNSLTYTPPPSLQDQITLVLYDVFNLVKDVTGIDVYGTIAPLIAMHDPPFFLTLGLDTRSSTFTSDDGTQWQTWEFHPPNPSGKTVVAFHGGGWIYQPTILNWIDYTSMARDTGATVVVPLYPLATTEAGRATEVIPDAADFISQQIEAHGAENVSLYADSAGNTIAMSAIRTLLRAGKAVPASMVLLSMQPDSSLTNPDIRDIDDPIVDIDEVDFSFSHFYDGITDLKDPLVSPLYFEDEVFEALPPTTVYVGEREILLPDTLLLYRRAVDEGAPVSVVVGTGLVHDWPVSGLPLYTATAGVRSDIYRQLGLSPTPLGQLWLAFLGLISGSPL